MKHVLVAVDGSEGAKAAARYAADLARPLGAKLTLLSVLEPRPPVVVGFVDPVPLATMVPTPDDRKAVEGRVAALAASLGLPDVESAVVFGPAADTVLAEAGQRGADLVVVGARGLGPVGRWVLGSVSDRVVHHARVPVLVVR